MMTVSLMHTCQSVSTNYGFCDVMRHKRVVSLVPPQAAWTSPLNRTMLNSVSAAPGQI